MMGGERDRTDPRQGLIHKFSGWIAGVVAFFLLLEKWHLVSRDVQTYFAGHFGSEYINFIMIGAIFVAWLGIYFAGHLLISSLLNRVYYAFNGA